MKVKTGFILREIAGECIIVPTGEAASALNGLITVNESGQILWEKLVAGTTIEELVECMLAEYEIDEATALADVNEFIDNLASAGILDK